MAKENKFKNLSSLRKTFLREQIVKKAAKMSPPERKKYVASLRAKGITRDSIGVGSNPINISYIDSLLGRTKSKPKSKPSTNAKGKAVPMAKKPTAKSKPSTRAQRTGKSK